MSPLLLQVMAGEPKFGHYCSELNSLAMPSLLPTNNFPARIVKENILRPETFLKFMVHARQCELNVRLKLTVPKGHISFPTKSHECSTSVPHLAGYSFIWICSNRDWATFIFPDVVSDESSRNKPLLLLVYCVPNLILSPWLPLYFRVSVLLLCDKWNLQNHTYCGTGTSILSGEWSLPEARNLGCVYICGGSCNNYSTVIITKAKVLRLWLQMSNETGNKARLRKEKGPVPTFSFPRLVTTSCFSAFVLLALKSLQSSLLGTLIQFWEAESFLPVTLKSPRWYKWSFVNKWIIRTKKLCRNPLPAFPNSLQNASETDRILPQPTETAMLPIRTYRDWFNSS